MSDNLITTFGKLQVGDVFRFNGSQNRWKKTAFDEAHCLDVLAITHAICRKRPVRVPKSWAEKYVIVSSVIPHGVGVPVFNYLVSSKSVFLPQLRIGGYWVRSLNHATRFTKSEVKEIAQEWADQGIPVLITKPNLIW